MRIKAEEWSLLDATDAIKDIPNVDIATQAINANSKVALLKKRLETLKKCLRKWPGIAWSGPVGNAQKVRLLDGSIVGACCGSSFGDSAIIGDTI